MGYISSGRPTGRPRQFYKYELPRGVVKIVSAQCADFLRKESAIREGNFSEEVLASYKRVNEAITQALSCIEEACRESILLDIAKNRGYEKSGIGVFISRRAYYNRKRKVIYDIAKLLHLI